jgi:hypothetical protein
MFAQNYFTSVNTEHLKILLVITKGTCAKDCEASTSHSSDISLKGIYLRTSNLLFNNEIIHIQAPLP